MATEIKEADLKLTPEQTESLAKTRASLADELAATTPPTVATDAELARFLESVAYDADAAATKYRAYLKWRVDNAIDKVLDSADFTKSDVINRIVPYAYHGYDSERRPIYFEQTGCIKAAALAAQVTPEEFAHSHIYGMEKLAAMAAAESKSGGVRVDSFVTVLDLEGLALSHLNVVSYLRACAEIDQAYYPGRLAKVLIINAPWIMPMAYNAVKGFLDDVTASRVHVLATLDELKEHIPEAVLPKQYGGACVCGGAGPLGAEAVGGARDSAEAVAAAKAAGLCLPLPDACEDLIAAGSQTEAEKHAHMGLTKKNVAAGARFIKEVACPANGGAFTWFFESEGAYDIDFTVEIVETDHVVVQTQRVCVSKGCHQSSSAQTLRFTWNNDYSYFNSKDVQYAINVDDVGDLKLGDIQVSKSSEDKAEH